MSDRAYYKLIGKCLAVIVGLLVLCRLTDGYAAAVVAAVGVICAVTGKTGIALCCYVFMPLTIVINPLLVPLTSAIAYAARFGPLLIGCVLAVTSSQRVGRHCVPLGLMIPFLLAACVSSIDGWFPKISYLKLINFSVFLLGLWLGTKNMHHRPKDVYLLRAFFMAVACFVILGSVILYPFPAYSQLSAMQLAMRSGDMGAAAELAQTAEGTSALFCGILNQSQALAPIMTCCVGWVVCDMLFILRKFNKIHLLLVGFSLPALYLTRSRCGFLAFSVMATMVYFYASQRVKMPQKMKRHVRMGMTVGLVLVGLVMIAAELKGGTMTRWLRKRDDLSSDARTFTEAVMASRQGLMEDSLRDFRKNPLLGMGFQVDENVLIRFGRTEGLIISASIEKGVLPTMILGETGLLGAILFVAFLVGFYAICNRKQFIATVTLFTTFIATNMGESTFFSPGGIGGIMWVVCLVGGFTIDTILLYQRNLERTMALAGQVGFGR